MFSLQPYDELEFSIPTTYQIPDHSLSEGNLISFSATHNLSSSQTTSFPLPSPRPRQSRHGFNDRRHMHRDTERRRREEMSKLYASLRALLPLEDCSKGRSSVCDQMEEAANYIKQMHNKIQELQARRDKLKKLHTCWSHVTNIVEISDGSDNCVAIQQVMGGLEILISNKSPKFELSRVLAQLVERELSVASCVSTRTKGGFLHKLEIQGKDMTSLDVLELHDRLTDAIK